MINCFKQSFCNCWPSHSDYNSDHDSVNTRAKVYVHDSNHVDSSKTGSQSKFRCRNIGKIEKNTSIISLDLRDTTETKFDGARLISVNFQINDRTFTSINGNNRDEEISETTKQLHDFSISILDCKGNRCFHTPDKKFQSNLMKCINDGMVSFYKISTNPDEIHGLLGKTYREVFGDNLNIPTCVEFARYLKYGIDDRNNITSHLEPLNYIDDIQDAPEFSHVVILDTKTNYSIHEFIHIAHGICLNKIGIGPIYFAQFNQIIECYDLCSSSYRLAISRKKLHLFQSSLLQSAIEG